MPFRIIRADITKVHADAIVSTANPEPRIGAGTERAVYEAAGREELLKARKPFGSIPEGSVFVTPGFDLDAEYIIHAVYPYYEKARRRECLDLLTQCCELALEQAAEKKLHSIAFPLLGTGSNHYPREDALQILTDSFMRFLLNHEMNITLAVFDHGSYHLSERLFEKVESYLDAQAVDQAIAEEYHASGIYNRRRKETALMSGSALHVTEKPSLNEAGSAAVFSHITQIPEDNVRRKLQALRKDRDQKESSDSLDELIRNRGETFQECLLGWVDRKGLTDAAVYRKANLTRQHFSKIRSNADYRPKKETVIALALALKLNLEETRDILEKAGYALSPANRADVIIQYFITHGIYDINKINISLFDHNEKQL